MNSFARQTGITSQQMREAPEGATFVWCNSHLSYPMALAKMLGRDDLLLRPLSWLTMSNVAPGGIRHVVLDHAARPKGEAFEAVMWLCDRGVVKR